MSFPLHLRRTATGLMVKVHPVVPMTVCDAFTRRAATQSRVIGTLLGVIYETHVYVSSCFTVPHSDNNDQVSVDIMHHDTMLKLHQKVSPKETIVGWFSTGYEVSSVDLLVQHFYSTLIQNPIYMMIDTTLESEEGVKISAHVTRLVHLKGHHIATEFVLLDTQIEMNNPESIGFQLLQNEIEEKISKGSENLLTTFKKLKVMVEEALKYVNEVNSGKKIGDPAIGRHLLDTLLVIPNVEKDGFQKMLNDRVQDLILITYLANLVQAQISISDKLNSIDLSDKNI